jgi:hypothetical protein
MYCHYHMTIHWEMGHDHHDTLKQCWYRKLMCHASFHPHAMWHNRFFHILPYLHFENEISVTGIENVMTDCGRILIEKDSNYLNARFAKGYNLCNRWRNHNILRQYIYYVAVNTTLYFHLITSIFIHYMFRPIGPSSGDTWAPNTENTELYPNMVPY